MKYYVNPNVYSLVVQIDEEEFYRFMAYYLPDATYSYGLPYNYYQMYDQASSLDYDSKVYDIIFTDTLYIGLYIHVESGDSMEKFNQNIKSCEEQMVNLCNNIDIPTDNIQIYVYQSN